MSLWDPQPLNRRKWYLKEDEVDDIEEEEEEEEEEGTSVDLPVQEIIKEESVSLEHLMTRKIRKPVFLTVVVVVVVVVVIFLQSW